MDGQPPTRRARLEVPDDSAAAEIRLKSSAFLTSLSRPVSPPNALKEVPKPKHTQSVPNASVLINTNKDSNLQTIRNTEHQIKRNDFEARNTNTVNIASPFQLTRVRGLPPQDNINTVTLHDILGDPLISEAWIFNFCFDVSWTMRHFDEDVRALIKVKIIHGSWKHEDTNRQGIEEDLKIWKNVEDIKAFVPSYGTHHSKMIILFKHDFTAQVIIHTANMLEKDWDHMTQAVWRSPILPKLAEMDLVQDGDGAIGSGSRFKADLLRYIDKYGKKLQPLSDKLSIYGFSAVRGALIASVPSHVKVSDSTNKAWGHLLLRGILRDLSSAQKDSPTPASNTSHLVSQVSSIATLPQSYLQETIYKAALPATTSIVYPTPSDLRSALTGYATGGSIHTKTATSANQNQVSTLRSQFHRWGTQSMNANTHAGRHAIPPHIKTYINFMSKPTAQNPSPDIKWALLTSANLSKQAWGTIPQRPKGSTNSADIEVQISSFEIGVLVWPGLFAEAVDHDPEDLDEQEKKTIVRMVPVFGKDLPPRDNKLQYQDRKEVLVGLRMPYDLPLTPYGANEMPWCPHETYLEPDSLGRTWP